ncbi:TPA: sugar-binding protein [Stenotrophomonas maltophilia]
MNTAKDGWGRGKQLKNPVRGLAVGGCALLMLVTASLANAQGLFSYQEYEKRVKSNQSLAAIPADDVFGDRTSSFDGSTEFSVEDVSIPGNFDLPVAIKRRFGVESVNRDVSGSEATGLTIFDDWEIEVPYMAGVWTNTSGWVTGEPHNTTTQRCTVNVAPTLLETHGYWDIGFGIDVKWLGGEGEELLVATDPSYASAPGLEDPKWMTASRARFGCLPATRNGYPGEAFIGYTIDGKKYFFDWGVEKPYAVSQFNDGAATRTVGRKRVYLLASRVEDRNGNWVSYSYNGYRLTSINSSDGRKIDLAYDTRGRVTVITANGRTWTYGYAEASGNNDGGLSLVTLPDGSRWTYSHQGRLQSRFPYRKADDEGGCAIRAGQTPPPTQMTVGAPSGAQGVFDFEMELFVRSDPCAGLQPSQYDTWSLKKRTITGPGLPPMVSAREYSVQLPGVGRWSILRKPDGSEIRERYGADPGLDERKLLQRQTLDVGGRVVKDEQTSYIYGAAEGPFPIRVGRSLGIMSGQFLAGTLSAVSETATTMDGDNYKVSYSAFNTKARPARVEYVGPSGSRGEVLEHFDSSAPWVQNQILKSTEASTGKVTLEYSYDSMARPVSISRAGALVQQVAYAADGTIGAVIDGRGNVSRVEDWYRGVPRLFTQGDGFSSRMTVDGNGWITSMTNQLGFTTSYQHDPMGRIREIVPPVDENQWQKTTISIRQMGTAEYGLGPGHWRVDNIFGERRQETYLDALWQPRLVREYDASNAGATQTYIRNDYDHEGRKTFTSYPLRDSNPVAGVWTEYDVLGRKTSEARDSEKGLLITSLQYGANATVLQTDAAGRQTSTRFEAYEAPDYAKPAQIIRADGSKQSFRRNAFGQITEIAQSAN